MFSPHKVLLIEDNFAQRILYSSRLKELGLDVGALNSTEDIPFFAKDNGFSILLVNINVGIEKTIEICSRVKQAHPPVATVVFSSISNHFVIEKFLNKQIDGFLAPVTSHKDLQKRLISFIHCYQKELVYIKEKKYIPSVFLINLEARGFTIKIIETKMDFANSINNLVPIAVIIESSAENSLGQLALQFFNSETKKTNVPVIGIVNPENFDELPTFFSSFADMMYPACGQFDFLVDKIEELAASNAEENPKDIPEKKILKENTNGILKTFHTCCQILKTQKKEINEAQNSLVSALREQKESLRKHSEMIKKEFEKRQEMEEQLFQAQKMEAIGLLTSGIAHDFNNILQVISGYTEILDLHFAETDPEKETVRNILHASNQAMGLSRQLLAFSRKDEIKKIPINILEALQKTVSLSKRTLGAKITIETEICADDLFLLADPVHFEQIFLNLFINARDAMPTGGKISISAEKINNADLKEVFPNFETKTSQTFVCFKVCDTGTGIPLDQVDKIFNPFFTTKEKDKGTGLGLATVQSCIEKHGGTIKVESLPKLGTTFTFLLPLDLQDQELIQQKSKVKSKLEEKLTILLAEDEPLVRDFAVNLLKKHGFNVLVAKDGLEAIELFQKNSKEISVLVFDVLMPGKTGKQAAEEIHQIRPDVPTLFCTGYCDELLKDDYLKKTGAKLLAKPYRPAELIKSITEMWHSQP